MAFAFVIWFSTFVPRVSLLAGPSTQDWRRIVMDSGNSEIHITVLHALLILVQLRCFK
jgi:hypothetical protein